MYFCSKTNQIHNISNLFYFGTTLYMFRTVSPSIIRSLRLYIQHQVYVILKFQKWVQFLVSVYLCSGKNVKYNVFYLRYCASGWFYYRIMRQKHLKILWNMFMWRWEVENARKMWSSTACYRRQAPRRLKQGKIIRACSTNGRKEKLNRQFWWQIWTTLKSQA